MGRVGHCPGDVAVAHKEGEAMFLKGWLSKIGVFITAAAAWWPTIQDGFQAGDGSKSGLIAGLMTLVLGIVRKLETIEKK